MPSFWIEPLDRICRRKEQGKHLRRLRQVSKVRQATLRQARPVLSYQSRLGDFEFRLTILVLSVCDPFQRLAFASKLLILQGALPSSLRRFV